MFLFDQGNYTSIRCYDKALGIDPNNVEALFNKGISLDNLGKFEGAITYYDKSTSHRILTTLIHYLTKVWL